MNIKRIMNFARKELKIYDVNGKYLKQGILNNNQQIQVGNLIKGVYFLTIDSKVRIRLIKA